MVLNLLKHNLRKRTLTFDFLLAFSLNLVLYFEFPRVIMISLYLWSLSSFWVSLLHAVISTPLICFYYSSVLMLGKSKCLSLFLFILFLFVNRISMVINFPHNYLFEIPVPLTYILLLLFPPVFSQRILGIFLRTNSYADSPKLRREWPIRSLSKPIWGLLFLLYSLITILLVSLVERKRRSSLRTKYFRIKEDKGDLQILGKSESSR